MIDVLGGNPFGDDCLAPRLAINADARGSSPAKSRPDAVAVARHLGGSPRG